MISAWCATRTLGEIAPGFDEQRVCWGLYRTIGDLLAHDPRVAPPAPDAAKPGASGAEQNKSVAPPASTESLFERIETAGVGRHRAAGTPIRIVAEARGATRPAPLLGQHTDEVLADVLGLDAPAVGRLHDAGIVAGPERDPTAAQRGS